MRFDTTRVYVKERRNVNILNMVLISVMIPTLIYVLLTYKYDVEITAPIIGIMIGLPAFIIVEMIVMTIILVKKIQNLYITISDVDITRTNGKKSERIYFGDMESVKIIYIPSGELKLIKLKGGGENIILIGLEDMESVKDYIVDGVDSSIVTDKKAKLNWYSPITNFFTFLVTMVILMPLILVGGSIYEYFNHIVILGLGLYFIMFKPSSKYYGARFRTFEVVIGVILLFTRVMTILL